MRILKSTHITHNKDVSAAPPGSIPVETRIEGPEKCVLAPDLAGYLEHVARAGWSRLLLKVHTERTEAGIGTATAASIQGRFQALAYRSLRDYVRMHTPYGIKMRHRRRIQVEKKPLQHPPMHVLYRPSCDLSQSKPRSG